MIVYLNDIKNLVIEFSKSFSEIFLCANDVAFADDELIKKKLRWLSFQIVWWFDWLTRNQANHDDDI
jgi:hypothetical protein